MKGQIFVPSVIYKSRQIPSTPDLFIRPASIVCRGFHLFVYDDWKFVKINRDVFASAEWP